MVEAGEQPLRLVNRPPTNAHIDSYPEIRNGIYDSLVQRPFGVPRNWILAHGPAWKLLTASEVRR
jgi:hypothetical protein